jgi:GTP-binding protein
MAQEITMHAEFVKGASAPSHFPTSTLPEVAMIGRSNVGKSSLINSLVRHGKLARVSNTPGKTQEINFFTTSLGLMLVDLPGYGYAKVSKTKREEFSSLINAYLFQREQLRLTCVLMDSRHEPQSLDLHMIENLEFAANNYVVILTKVDKLSESEQQERFAQVKQVLQYCSHAVDVVLSSAEKNIGRNSILGIMKKFRVTEQS